MTNSSKNSQSDNFNTGEIQKVIEILTQGGILLYPTDTIWGIGCLTTNETAIQKVRSLKKIPNEQGMVILVPDINWISKYVPQIPEIAYQLIDVAIDPLTIVYPQAKNLPESLLAPDGSVAIRITSDNFCRTLLSKLNAPLVSTSANIYGSPYPSTFSKIDKIIMEQVDYVVEYRQNERIIRRPSEIIKVGLHNEIKIIRSAKPN